MNDGHFAENDAPLSSHVHKWGPWTPMNGPALPRVRGCLTCPATEPESAPEAPVEFVGRLLGERHMRAVSPSYLADQYAAHAGLSRDEAITVLTALHKTGALIACEFDGFPMVTTPDRSPNEYPDA